MTVGCQFLECHRGDTLLNMENLRYYIYINFSMIQRKVLPDLRNFLLDMKMRAE